MSDTPTPPNNGGKWELMLVILHKWCPILGERGSKMTQKKQIIEGKDRIKGGKRVKNDSKKSFMYDPLGGVGASEMIDIAYSSLLWDTL